MAFRARQRQLTGAANSLLFRTSHTAVRSIITAHRTYATEADKANSKAGLEGLSQEERAVIEASRKTKAQNQPQQQQQAPETFKITEVKSARTRNHSTLKIRKYDPLEKRGSTLFESNQVASQLIKQGMST